MKDIDKYHGCLLGGAAGDALGYPVEFLQYNQIFRRYGNKGITEYELTDGKAEISDDTQMTLFTANGLLLGTAQMAINDTGRSYPDYIALCYQDWLNTQRPGSYQPDGHYDSWLIHIPELRHSRAPGVTCINALQSGISGTIANPINQRKGCGGVMRVAPIGLYLHERCSSDEIDMIGAQAAALTHGHELVYIPAAMLVHIINLISHSEDIELHIAVMDAMSAVKRLFPGAEHMDEFIKLIEKAIDLSSSDKKDIEAITELGVGWVAEETMAIAIYCSLKYQNDFDQAIIAAVNHSGDSDSTGSVTGNILGAHLGLKAIPVKYIELLEAKEIILEIADDLCHDYSFTEAFDETGQKWKHKYISCDFKP